MIRNEREYRITKAAADKFRVAIESTPPKPPPKVHPKLRQASIDAMKAESKRLLEEIAAYDELQASGGRRLRGEFRDLAVMLIQARIARGWTQCELAERLGLHMQKIQQSVSRVPLSWVHRRSTSGAQAESTSGRMRCLLEMLYMQ